MKVYKLLFLKSWLLVTMFCSLSFAQSSAEEVLQKSNVKYLSGRVYAMLAERLLGVTRCSFAIQNDLLTSFKKFPKYTEDQAVLEDLISLYYKTYQVGGNCQISMNSGENTFHDRERTKFSGYFSVARKLCNALPSIDRNYNDVACESQLSQILSDLNPHCISTQVPFDPKYHDSFICMAGDILIGKKLYEFFPDPYDQFTEIKSFLLSYWNKAHQALTTNTTLELYSVFKDDKTDSYRTRLRFLSVMTFLLASTKSTSPYIKGFQDYIWRTHVLKTGNAKEAVDLFVKFRSITDEFKTIHTIIEQKKIKVNVLGQDMRAINRHNMMAMFLACNYQGQAKIIRKGLPLASGYAYESFDFLSHIKEHDTFEQALENFKTDTNRYDTGVSIGEKFCSFL